MWKEGEANLAQYEEYTADFFSKKFGFQCRTTSVFFFIGGRRREYNSDESTYNQTKKEQNWGLLRKRSTPIHSNGYRKKRCM